MKNQKPCPCGCGRPLILYRGRQCLVCGPLWEKIPSELKLALMLEDTPLAQKRSAARKVIELALLTKRSRPL